MPRSEKRVRVEDGLYLAGKTYMAAATPPGARQARFRTLGEVGIMEARRLRDDFRHQVRHGNVPSARASRVKLGDVVDIYIEHLEHLRDIDELAPRTFDKYEGDLRLHVKGSNLGGRAVTSISAEDLVGWHRDQRAAGASTWAIRARWVVLRGVLSYAVRYKLIAANPADTLTSREIPKAGEGRKRVLSRLEMEQLLARAPHRHADAIATDLFTGLRQAELLGLIWSEVDFGEEVFHVTHQMGRDGKRRRLKTPGSQRDVVMMPGLATRLRARRLASPWSRDDDLVFATELGTTIGHRNLAQRGLDVATGKAAKKRAAKAGEIYERCGLEDVTFHTLRHTFATMLIADPENDIVFISRQLGHANPAITLRVYAHEFETLRRAEGARDRLDRDFGDVLGKAAES